MGAEEPLLVEVIPEPLGAGHEALCVFGVKRPPPEAEEHYPVMGLCEGLLHLSHEGQRFLVLRVRGEPERRRPLEAHRPPGELLQMRQPFFKAFCRYVRTELVPQGFYRGGGFHDRSQSVLNVVLAKGLHEFVKPPS